MFYGTPQCNHFARQPADPDRTGVKVGDKAPDFTMLDGDLKPVKLADTAGAVRLFSVVTSLDTGTCSIQTRTFEERLAKMGDKVKVYTISADLPFAQSRFGAENGINRLSMLSDYRDMSFGDNYGLWIKELRLLARAIVVVGKDDTIKYIQVGPENSAEPNYDAALVALEKVLKE